MSAAVTPVVEERETTDVVGVVIRALAAVTAGVTAGAVFGIITTSDTRFLLPLLIGLPLSILIPSLAMVRGALRGGLTTSPYPAAPPAPTRWTLGRVQGIRRTGMTINDQPQCDVDLVVADDSYAGGYLTTLRIMVDVVDLPRFQPGCVLALAVGDDGAAERVLTAPPSDAAQAVADEQSAATGTGRVPRPDGLPRRETAPGPLLPFSGPSPRRMLAATACFAVGVVAVLLLGGVL